MSRRLERLKERVPLGTPFDRLIVVGYAKNSCGVWSLRCRCSCGNETIQRRDALQQRKIKSCGCYIHEKITKYGIHKRLPPGVSQLNSMFYQHGLRCRKRKIETLITKEQFRVLVTSRCHFCGLEPSSIFVRSYVNGTFLYGGIDRLDSDKGYTGENSVSCCKWCNSAKNVMTTDGFKAWLRRAAEHFLGMT